jgi:hypothetical protein
MVGSNSNLSTIDGQQVTAAAKRKEDDTVTVAQAAAAIAHREQRLSSLSWLLRAKPWTRHGRASAPPSSLGRMRRPLLVTWNSSSPLPKRS